MGLIKAAKGAIGSALHDQWKDEIRCEELTNDVLMVKKTTETGVISNGSIIVVAPGQCAILYDNGRVIDATAEEGIYEFDDSSTPSFFAGQFKDVFKEMWERFTYNGDSSKQQAVFFFNIKEIIDNKFGTSIPVPFQDWSHPILNEMTNTVSPLRLEIKCFGKYTFKINNPALFMNVTSGVSDTYTKDDLEDQIKSEVIGVLQNIINELGNTENKVPVLELPSKTDEIKQIIDERNLDAIIKKRGIELVGFTIESVTLTDESEEKIDNYEYSTNTMLQKARMVDSYANAIENAASNSAGALNGMIGVSIMNMTTGNAVKEAAENVVNSSNKFCSNCGKKVEKDAKFCSNCGKEV